MSNMNKKLESELLPLLLSGIGSKTAAENILKVRDTFDKKEVTDFLCKLPPKEKETVFYNVIDYVYNTNKDLKTVTVDYLVKDRKLDVIAKFNKGRKPKKNQERWLVFTDDLRGKTAVLLIGYSDDIQTVTDFIFYREVSPLDYTFLSLLDLKEGTVFTQRGYNYYLTSMVTNGNEAGKEFDEWSKTHLSRL